jgi:hypothetical protein
MDYEFRIKLLEQETAHFREMQKLLRERQDTTDERMDKLQALSKETLEAVAALTGNITILAAKVDQIADMILGKRSNGG